MCRKDKINQRNHPPKKTPSKQKNPPKNPREIAYKENNMFEKPKKKHCATFTIYIRKLNGTEDNHLCLTFNYMQKKKCSPFTLLNQA